MFPTRVGEEPFHISCAVNPPNTPIIERRMTQFRYTAQKAGGEVYRAVAEAPDRFALYEVIRREGGTVLAVQEDNTRNIWSIAYWNAKISTVPEQEKILFARNLGTMLKAGLALSRALSVIERQTKQPKFSFILANIGGEVRRGAAFHEALAKYPAVFPRIFIAMVKAGEEGGDLPAAL